MAIARRRVPWLSALAAIVLLSLFLWYASNPKTFTTRVNQLGILVEERILLWDWKETPEEAYCRSPHDLVNAKAKIPNVVHFILLAEQDTKAELHYSQFLAIKAAILNMDGAEIKLHTYGLDTANPWWKLLSKHVTLVQHSPDEFQGPHDLSLRELRLPHQADLMRLHILLDEGGIYLDTDVYTLKSFRDLLSNPRDAVMGHEGGNRYGLCNGVILARPRSEFLVKWLETYKSFDPNIWNQHSVRIPKQLQAEFPELICPLSPPVFFWPTWAIKHVHYMYDVIEPAEIAGLEANVSRYGGAMYSNQLAVHGWGAHDQLAMITEENIQTDDTRFNVLLREVAAAPL